jgi:hypothetical protein
MVNFDHFTKIAFFAGSVRNVATLLAVLVATKLHDSDAHHYIRIAAGLSLFRSKHLAQFGIHSSTGTTVEHGGHLNLLGLFGLGFLLSKRLSGNLIVNALDFCGQPQSPRVVLKLSE